MSDHNLDFKELIIFIRELYTIIHHYCRAPCITGCSAIVKIFITSYPKGSTDK
jgi:hypothetical protein